MNKLEEQLKTMFGLQETMNATVNPNWRSAGNKWTDAIMVEAVEAFDHTNWKWWKNTSAAADLNQIRLEVVDIWHFALSAHMEKYPSIEDAISTVLGVFQSMEPVMRMVVADDENRVWSIQDVLRRIIDESSSGKSDSLFSRLLYLGVFCDLPFNEVYKLYLGKNTLNLFRQANGYKQGTYVKMWAGQEDNEVLTEILNSFGEVHPTYEELYKTLEASYKVATGAKD